MKKTLRKRIDHYLRKRRKGLHKLSSDLSKISEMVDYAVARPVDIFRMSEHYISKLKTDESYGGKIDIGINELIDSKKTSEEAANIFVSVLLMPMSNPIK